MERETQIDNLIERRELPIRSDIGASELAAELVKNVRGEVRFDDGYRALYATDASNYRQVPLGVVAPLDANDVVAAIAICRAFDVPIVSRGGGTSLAGQTCNAAVVLDFSKYMHGIIELDPEKRIAHIEPGLVLDELRNRAEEFHLTFGPDPATHTHCTLGGMMGNNSCGTHSMMAGCTDDNVEQLEIVTYDGIRLTVGATTFNEMRAVSTEGGRLGEIYGKIESFCARYRDAILTGFPELPRRVSGYNLPALAYASGPHIARALVGSEGTLVTILSAKVRLVASPPCRVLLVLGYPSIFEAADQIPEIAASNPIGLEGIDDVLVDDMKRKGLHPERVQLLPEGNGWLLVEFGGDSREEAEQKAQALISRLSKSGYQKRAMQHKLFDDAEQEKIIWKIRESGLGATARVPGQADTWEGWEDSSVPPEKLGSYLRKFHRLLNQFGFRAALYGHFGQGCLHTRIPFDLKHDDGIAKFRSFVEHAADLVVAHGGSLSGEHGDGQSRAELLPKMFKPELIEAFAEWKAIWDPQNKMNPGKIVSPYRLDENLRLRVTARPDGLKTTFKFPEDRHSFAYAAERCVGVGECRRLEHGTMCPSYMVTREEMHSTRGRARLLFEMVLGDPLGKGWRNEAVREALDLCLSCKGCKGECPVNVDMASYKAEFLSHYYKGRVRSRSAYAFGLIYWWARAASIFPGFVNLLTSSRVTSGLVKRVAGIEPSRSLPQFAPVTFKEWWRERPVVGKDLPRVILWVDTWSNHFQPEIPLAAVEVLENAGFRVVVPLESLCCGRPLYDYGMLDLAKRSLRKILNVLGPALREGLPIVGLEPSCISIFRDEAANLFPDDPDVRRLGEQSFMLGDFLLSKAPNWQAPTLTRHALVQGHCHHKSILSFEKEMPLLKKMNVDIDVLDSGCCGMAGAFGYEREHYPVSVACAERELLPAIRKAKERDIIIADGFSCREQIQQLTTRRALHTAQVIQIASKHGPGGPELAKPEQLYESFRLATPWRRRARNIALASIALGAAFAIVRRRK